MTYKWSSWFAWRPVRLCHGYGQDGAYAWMCWVRRRRLGGRYEYSLRNEK